MIHHQDYVVYISLYCYCIIIYIYICCLLRQSSPKKTVFFSHDERTILAIFILVLFDVPPRIWLITSRRGVIVTEETPLMSLFVAARLGRRWTWMGFGATVLEVAMRIHGISTAACPKLGASPVPQRNNLTQEFAWTPSCWVHRSVPVRREDSGNRLCPSWRKQPSLKANMWRVGNGFFSRCLAHGLAYLGNWGF